MLRRTLSCKALKLSGVISLPIILSSCCKFKVNVITFARSLIIDIIHLRKALFLQISLALGGCNYFNHKIVKIFYKETFPTIIFIICQKTHIIHWQFHN